MRDECSVSDPVGRPSRPGGQCRVPRLPLPPGEFQAYLLDCDGTIADSMPLHYLAWREALAEWRCTFTEERFYAWGGMPPVVIVERLASEQGLTVPADRVAQRK